MYRSTLLFSGWASASLHRAELWICYSALWNQSTSLLPSELPKQNRLKTIRTQHSAAFQGRWHFNGWTAPLALKSSCKQVFSQAILQAFVGSALQRNLLVKLQGLSGSERCWVSNGGRIPVLSRNEGRRWRSSSPTWLSSLFAEDTNEEMLQTEWQISSL